MKDRKKRTLVIGILCCLLVFMGVGFAVMNATLNINGTATAINTWDVRMTNIEVIEKSEGATNEEDTKINEDGISANFKTDFTKPGDFITYKVTIENKGSIDAVLNDISVTLNVSETDKDLFNITDTRPNNQLLEAGTSTTFTLKVEFRSDADRMPSGDIEYIVKVDYSQQTGEIGGEVAPEEDWLYKIDESGTITAYNYNSKLVEDTSHAVVPATINGTPVKAITPLSFSNANIGWLSIEGEELSGFVIYDELNYEVLINKLDEIIGNNEALKKYYKKGDSNIPDNAQIDYMHIDIDKSGFDAVTLPSIKIDSLDLSQAIHLETIADNSFAQLSDSNNKLSEITFPINGALKTIGERAFYNNQITDMYFPKTVTNLGDMAFSGNNFENLTIEKCTVDVCRGNGASGAYYFGKHKNLTVESGEIGNFVFRDSGIETLTLKNGVTSIGQGAFYSNAITELVIPEGIVSIGRISFWNNRINSLTIPNSVTTIGDNAFAKQTDASGNPTLNSILIKRTEEDFLASVTISVADGYNKEWYDDTLNPTIVYDPS